MGIFKRLAGSSIHVIEWDQLENNEIVYHFPRYQELILYGAKLIVRPGQNVIFMNSAKVLDSFSEGEYRLDYQTLPKLAKLQSWSKESQSDFIADIYFFNSKGTFRVSWDDDALIVGELKEAFIVKGSYRASLKKPALFLNQVSDQTGVLEIERHCKLLASEVKKALCHILIQNPELCSADIATSVRFISEKIKNKVAVHFGHLGLSLDEVLIDDIHKVDSTELGESVKDQATNSEQNLAEYSDQKEDELNEQDSDSQALIADQPKPKLPKIYYVMILGERVGPLDLDEVFEKMEQEEIDETTLYWHKGMSSWSELKGLIAQ